MVVDLRIGLVRTNLIKNLKESKQPSLPKGSIYEPAKEVIEKALRQDGFEGQGMPAKQWADAVVQDLLKKNPPPVIWRGESAWLTRIATMLPFGMLDGTMKKLVGLDVFEQMLGMQICCANSVSDRSGERFSDCLFSKLVHAIRTGMHLHRNFHQLIIRHRVTYTSLRWIVFCCDEQTGCSPPSHNQSRRHWLCCAKSLSAYSWQRFVVWGGRWKIDYRDYRRSVMSVCQLRYLRICRMVVKLL